MINYKGQPKKPENKKRLFGPISIRFNEAEWNLVELAWKADGEPKTITSWARKKLIEFLSETHK